MNLFSTSRMSHLCIVLLFVLTSLEVFCGQVTHVRRTNPLLSRRKRYLSFPTGSNIILTLSAVKAVMQTAPKGYNLLGECDVPFALPNDTRKVFENKFHYRQRRMVYSQLEEALTRSGLNGNACIKSFICDVESYISKPDSRMHLVQSLLAAIFRISNTDDIEDYCEKEHKHDCDFPFLKYLVGSLTNND